MVANGVLVGRLPRVGRHGSAQRGDELAPPWWRCWSCGVLSLVAWIAESLGAVAARAPGADPLGRHWDQELMAAIAGPVTIAHLEDPAMPRRLETASGRRTRCESDARLLFAPAWSRAILTGLIRGGVVATFPVAGVAFLVACLPAGSIGTVASAHHRRDLRPVDCTGGPVRASLALTPGPRKRSASSASRVGSVSDSIASG